MAVFGTQKANFIVKIGTNYEKKIHYKLLIIFNNLHSLFIHS